MGQVTFHSERMLKADRARIRLEPADTRTLQDVRTPTRVAIIDDHTLFALAINCVLADAGIGVVGCAGTVSGGMKLVAETIPDVVLADYCLPDGDGLSMSKAIMKAYPSIRVVLVSASDDIGHRDLLAAGFSGYLTKNTPLPRFVEAIKEMGTGRVVRAPRIKSRMPRGDDINLIVSQLTRRERQVLALLSKGQRGPQIATNLDISPNTVRSYVQNILTKLQVGSRLEAVAFAVRHGLTDVDSLQGSGPVLATRS